MQQALSDRKFRNVKERNKKMTRRIYRKTGPSIFSESTTYLKDGRKGSSSKNAEDHAGTVYNFLINIELHKK